MTTALSSPALTALMPSDPALTSEHRDVRHADYIKRAELDSEQANGRNADNYNYRAGYQFALIPERRVGEISLHRKAVGVYIKHMPRKERESAAQRERHLRRQMQKKIAAPAEQKPYQNIVRVVAAVLSYHARENSRRDEKSRAYGFEYLRFCAAPVS